MVSNEVKRIVLNYKLTTAVSQNVLIYFPMVDNKYCWPPGFEELINAESNKIPSKTWLDNNGYKGKVADTEIANMLENSSSSQIKVTKNK